MPSGVAVRCLDMGLFLSAGRGLLGRQEQSSTRLPAARRAPLIRGLTRFVQARRVAGVLCQGERAPAQSRQAVFHAIMASLARWTARRSGRSLQAPARAVSVRSPPAWARLVPQTSGPAATCWPESAVPRLPAGTALLARLPPQAAGRALPASKPSEAILPNCAPPHQLLKALSSCQIVPQ